MATHPPSGGGASATSGLDKARKWLIRGAIILGAVGVLFLIIHFILPLIGKGGERTDVRERSADAQRVAVATPTISSRTISAAIVCKPWSFEPQQCTFDNVPTEGFGQRDMGTGFCLDIHYGPDQAYRFQRWDPASREFVDITDSDGPDVRVSRTRFVGNRTGETVTVTYWLEGSNGCGATPPPSPEPEAVRTAVPADQDREPTENVYGQPLGSYRPGQS